MKHDDECGECSCSSALEAKLAHVECESADRARLLTYAKEKLADAEGKALAYDDAHVLDWHERAHKLAQQSARDAGRNVWHIAVERAEKAEAERDLLAAECRASRECNACYRYIEHGVGEPRTDEQWESASAALATAMAATDAAGVLKEGK